MIVDLFILLTVKHKTLNRLLNQTKHSQDNYLINIFKMVFLKLNPGQKPKGEEMKAGSEVAERIETEAAETE